MYIFWLFALMIAFETLCNLNTVYAAARDKPAWSYTQWTDGGFVNWWRKISWLSIIGAIALYVTMAVAAVIAEQEWFIGFLDAWLYTRIPCWLLLTARAKRVPVNAPLNRTNS